MTVTTMSRRLLLVVSGAALAVSAGCSSEADRAGETSADTSPVSTSASRSRPPADPPLPLSSDEVDDVARHGALGQSLTIGGLDDGERYAVTVLAYRRDVEGLDPDLDVPATGNRYDAVQLRIHNIGTVAYENAPSNETRVVDAKQQVFKPGLADESKAGPDFDDDPIAPGAGATGWVTFELLETADVTAVRFDAGDLDGGAEWSVR